MGAAAQEFKATQEGVRNFISPEQSLVTAQTAD